MPGVKKIVVIGPESTGKSTLCATLARHYDTVWVREYARQHLLLHGMQYSYEDLLTIARGQLQAEDLALTQARNGVLFIDTDMYVMKVWCEYVFGRCHYFILDQIARRQYDGYLLANTDLPWVRDELREYPDEENRRKLFRIYKDLLVNQRTPWFLISGLEATRADQALAAVRGLLGR